MPLKPLEALSKAMRFCALQERCHSEVREKLYGWGVYGLAAEQILAELISQGFLNEERFACAFASGKFRIKGWGRKRIEHALRARQVSDYCIRRALQELPEDEYQTTLHNLLCHKYEELVGKTSTGAERRGALFRFAAQRGYETDLIWNAIRQLAL